MPTFDREEVLARIDLPQLFDDLGLGPVRREGAGFRAACPGPHEQTGKSPPVTMNQVNGSWVWHCHNCDAGGSAIDALAVRDDVSIGEAIARLAERTGARAQVHAAGKATSSTHTPRPRPVTGDVDELEAWVAACADALWSPEGADVLAELRARGLSDEVLRAQRVGADLGPAWRPRSAGLPRNVGAVFPVLDSAGTALYAQLRLMGSSQGGKYRNPSEDRWGASPRVAAIQADGANPDLLVVCEGMPDAYTAAGAGFDAAAVLGTAAVDPHVAQRLLALAGDRGIVLALDADKAGATARDRLADLLAEAGAGMRVYALKVPEKHNDLNGWAVAAGEAFLDELAEAFARAEPAGWAPPRTAVDVYDEMLAKLRDEAGAMVVPTGLASLDTLLARGGWRPGLFLLGGLPGSGKSAFALQAALHATSGGAPVLYVSVEQGEEELLGRVFTRELQMPISAYWNRSPNFLAGVQDVRPRFAFELLFLRADPWIAEDHQGTAGRVRQWAKEIMAATGRRPLVIVDYLQRMRPPLAEARLDERVRIGASGHQLRQLARDLELPIVVISSVGRANYGPDARPELSWFKGSGELEYDADAALILRPIGDDETSPRPIELHLLKSRYGSLTGDKPIPLKFDRRYGTFAEAAAPAVQSGPPPRV